MGQPQTNRRQGLSNRDRGVIMKLRRSERTHQQLRADQSENMNLYQPDEFAFNADMSAIALPCRGGRFDRCIVRISTAPADHPVWHWDGNLDTPTLTPSINCSNRCGWHGNLVSGELLP